LNKRQRKKREKIIKERIKFINNLWFSFGRRNGKTLFQKALYKICTTKKYRPFKLYKKWVNESFISVKASSWLGRQFERIATEGPESYQIGIDLSTKKDLTVIYDELHIYNPGQ
jgi:hypothetical protein